VESLRWILLAAGITFVIIVYALGRSRRQRNHSVVDELEDDLPAFSANSLDDVDEGVGEVRVVSGVADDVISDSDVNVSASDESFQNEAAKNGNEGEGVNDIVVLYILPKPEQMLLGSQINSAAQAMGLSFAEMNIFHYKADGRSVFSLANMLEPGSFDADTMHDLKTTGLTIFMQMVKGDPLDDLTEMLQRSYQLAGLLDARLCNHRREPLTEQDAENYRTQVAAFIASEEPELLNET